MKSVERQPQLSFGVRARGPGRSWCRLPIQGVRATPGRSGVPTGPRPEGPHGSRTRTPPVSPRRMATTTGDTTAVTTPVSPIDAISHSQGLPDPSDASEQPGLSRCPVRPTPERVRPRPGGPAECSGSSASRRAATVRRAIRRSLAPEPRAPTRLLGAAGPDRAPEGTPGLRSRRRVGPARNPRTGRRGRPCTRRGCRGRGIGPPATGRPGPPPGVPALLLSEDRGVGRPQRRPVHRCRARAVPLGSGARSPRRPHGGDARPRHRPRGSRWRYRSGGLRPRRRPATSGGTSRLRDGARDRAG